MVLGLYRNRAIINSWVDITKAKNVADIIPDFTMGMVTQIKVWKSLAPRSVSKHNTYKNSLRTAVNRWTAISIYNAIISMRAGHRRPARY